MQNAPVKTPTKTVIELLGAPPQAKDGRDRLLVVAVELLYRRGFAQTGIDQVIDAAGVTKSTFYKHFESKEDLMIAAVQLRDHWEAEAWNRAIAEIAGDDLHRKPLAMLDVLDQWFNAPDYQGCMFMNAAAEFPNPNDPVHQASAVHHKRVRDNWRDLAKAAGADAANAETFADCFTALIQGALLMRQTQARNDAARVIRPAVEQLVHTYLPAAGSKKPARKLARS